MASEDSGAKPASDPKAPERQAASAPAPAPVPPPDSEPEPAEAPPEAQAAASDDDGESESDSDPQLPEPPSSGPPPTLLSVAPEGGLETKTEAGPSPAEAAPARPAADPEDAGESAAESGSAEFQNGVQYMRTTYGDYPLAPQYQATKQVYRSQCAQAALAFLKTQVVTQPLFYIEVETPDGVFGVDEGRRVFDGNGRFIEA
jgi:hypothetical protein